MYKLSEELYQYQINILHLSLRIRFACRVFLEFNQKQITEEVTANEFALFIFDQQCTLRQNSAH